MVIRTSADSSPRIDASAYVDQSAQIIGDVVIGRHSSVWPQAVIRADIHKIRIGERTNIQDASVLHVTHDSDYAPGGFALLIGNGVTVGHACILHGCQIGDHCLIGMGSIIMDGAVVEPEVMLAAGSLVSPGKTLESGYLWMGRPAQRVRALDDQELQYLLYAAEHYVKLKNSYQST